MRGPPPLLGSFGTLRLVDRPLSGALIRSSDGLEHEESGGEGRVERCTVLDKAVVMKRVTVGGL